MAFIRNDSSVPQNGPFCVIAPGDVVEVPDHWLNRRDDRVRRGQFTVVEAPAVAEMPAAEVVNEPKPAKAKKAKAKKSDE